MDVIGHVAVAVMPALRVPILLISIVITEVPAIDRRLRVAIRPLRRHAARRLDPAAESRHVLQAVAALRTAGKADEIDLHRRTAIRFGTARRMLQRADRHVGVGVLIDRPVVDGEMGNVPGRAIGRKRRVGARSLGRVMHDLEGMPAHIGSRRTVERHPDDKWAFRHDRLPP